MTENTQLRTNSTVFWLVALIGAGIVFIGSRFLVEPIQGARGFGVPASDTFTYLWAKGTRDIVSGLLVFALLWLKASRRILGAFLLVASLIPVGDMINVYLSVGSVPALMIHGGTALFMWVLAYLLLRS